MRVAEFDAASMHPSGAPASHPAPRPAQDAASPPPPCRSASDSPERPTNEDAAPRAPTAQLLADFGHDLPTKPEPERPGKEPYLFHASPRHGQRRPGRGWNPARTPVVQYRMTSDQAAAWWPFIANPPLPPTGAQIGIDELSGGSFYADPLGWVLDDSVPVTNPNVITFGKPGGGKSTNTKNFATLMMDFGYKIFVLGDPKDEYEPLCRAFGVQPFAVGPGMSARINPLDFGPLGDGWDSLDRVEAQRRAGIIFRRWLTLIRGLVGSQFVGEQRVPFGPTDARVVEAALAQLTGYLDGHHTLHLTTIPALWQLLANPTEQLVTECRYAPAGSSRRDPLLRMPRPTGQGRSQACSTPHHHADRRHPSIVLPVRLEPLGDGPWHRVDRSPVGRAMRRSKHRRPADQHPRRCETDAPRPAVKSLTPTWFRRDSEIQFVIDHKPGDMLTVGESTSAATAIAKNVEPGRSEDLLTGPERRPRTR